MTVNFDRAFIESTFENTSTDAESLRRLRAALVDDASRQGLIDVAYRTIETPVGSLLIAATEVGLVRVAFHRENYDAVLDALATSVSPRVLRAPRRLDSAATQVDQYFAGTRTAFDLPLDHALSQGFRRDVRALLPTIPYGQTRSYAELARLAGNPRAVRAAASACATNPLPIVVPCHRVVRSDGTLGGYVGGLDAKAALLAVESVR